MSLIGKSIGNYQIKAKLGEGGMGAVYLGEHPLIGKRVAIKVLLEELAAKEDIVARFFNEAKAVNDIGHSNIVDIVDFGKVKNDYGQDIVYFIMEFLDGESLAARLRRTGLSFKETMHVMQQCVSALAASHAKGIVHRDLKPENIYLCPRGNDKNFTKLLDFGIAKLTGDSSQSHKTRTGLVIGTPAYMSPEQCEGKGLIDHRSDIYSLGIVMYELLTGRVPFPGEGFGEILVAHLTRQPDPPSAVNPDVSPQLEAIVLHAIEKDRNRRFQSMDELAAALENPDAHFAQWQGLPAPTPVGAQHSGGTVMLDDGGLPLRGPTGAQPLVRQTGANRPITGQRGPTTQTAPTPTTLSGAASETMNQLPRKSRMPLIVGIGGAAALAAILGVVALNKKASDTTSGSLPPPPEEVVTVTVNSDPPNAKVTRADTNETGTTPWAIKVKKGAAFDVLVKLDGYQPQPRSINGDRSYAVLIPLTKLPEAPPPVQQAVNVPPSGEPAVEKPAADARQHKRRGIGASGSSKEKVTAPDKGDGGKGDKDKPSKGHEETDDMKLLQPKF